MSSLPSGSVRVNMLSPPCGKPKGDLVHHTNLAEADTDDRKLICYHCGVACDLQNMRVERKAFLESLGALTPRPRHQSPLNNLSKRVAVLLL